MADRPGSSVIPFAPTPGAGGELPALALQGLVIERGGKRLLDGLTARLPRSGITAVMGPKESDQILGLLIDEDLDVPGAPPVEQTQNAIPDVSSIRTLSRMKSLLDTATQGHDKFVLDGFEHLVARMPAKGYGTTEFDMSDERRAAIIAAGRTALGAYFDRPLPGMIPLPPAQAAAAQQELQRVADRVATKILE